MEKQNNPKGQLILNVFRNNKNLNIWEESVISIDFYNLFIEYFEPHEIKLKRKDIECVRAKLNTGKVFYPAYNFDTFKKIYYDFLISLELEHDSISAN